MAGGNIDNLYIAVSASAKGASNALDKVAKALEKIADLSSNSGLKEMSDQLETATKSAKGLSGELKKIDGVKAKITSTTGATNKLNGAMGSLWQTLKKVASISSAIALFKKGYGMSTDFFETANYFRVVMGEYTEDAYKYAQSVSEALGLDESQWMNNQATFMSLAVTFGNTADSAYLMSKNLTQLVYDLSSLKNVDATTAMQKLRSAFAGEIEPLRDWGVDLSKANLQLIALEHNITKPFDKMTQAEKSQLRYVTIMNQLEYAMGDLQNTLSSPGNQIRLLEISVQKLARAFGNILIPILNQVVPVLIAVANAIRNVVQTIAEFFGYEYPDMSNWEKYGDGIGTVADNMDDATGAAKKLKKQLAGFDEINNLTTNSGGSGSSASGYFGGLDLPTYESLGKSFLSDALDKKIDGVLSDLPKKITSLFESVNFEQIGKALGDGLANIDWKQIVKDVGNIISSALTGIGDFILGSRGGIWEAGLSIVEGLIEAIDNAFVNIAGWAVKHIYNPINTELYENMPAQMRALVQKLIENIGNIKWDKIGKAVGDALARINWKEVVSGTADLLISLADLLIEGFKSMVEFLIGASGGLIDTGISIATGILEGIGRIWNSITSWLSRNVVKPFVDGIKSLFGIHSPSTVMAKIGNDLVLGLQSGLTGIWDAVKSIFTNLWNNITTSAKDAWEAVKKAFSPVTTWFSDKFGKAWEAVKKVFSGEISFKDIKDAVGTAFTKMINKLIEGLNKVIASPFNLLNKTLNKIREISILGLQPFIKLWGMNPITVPQIPTIKLATGGVVNQPTTALIGENGAEAVVPLENNTQWITKVANEINNNSDDSQIVVMLGRVIDAINSKDFEVTIGDSDIYNANKRETNRQQRLLGRAY